MYSLDYLPVDLLDYILYVDLINLFDHVLNQILNWQFLEHRRVQNFLIMIFKVKLDDDVS